MKPAPTNREAVAGLIVEYLHRTQADAARLAQLLDPDETEAALQTRAAEYPQVRLAAILAAAGARAGDRHQLADALENGRAMPTSRQLHLHHRPRTGDERPHKDREIFHDPYPELTTAAAADELAPEPGPC